jgi:cytosine/adenosine deaminase-related metal-dependent hydrolase
VDKAVEGATLIAAKGLGRDDLGRIRPGAKADLITIDVTGFLVGGGALPPEPLSNLLYTNGTAVRHVLTDGTFQYYDGHMVVDDEKAVMRRGGKVMTKIWNHLEEEGWFRSVDPTGREAREHLPPRDGT